MSGANNNHQVYYSKGFEKSISDTHSWRTVENSAKYVIPLIKPNFKILDVGCGPGSITIDFAKTIYHHQKQIIMVVVVVVALLLVLNQHKN